MTVLGFLQSQRRERATFHSRFRRTDRRSQALGRSNLLHPPAPAEVRRWQELSLSSLGCLSPDLETQSSPKDSNVGSRGTKVPVNRLNLKEDAPFHREWQAARPGTSLWEGGGAKPLWEWAHCHWDPVLVDCRTSWQPSACSCHVKRTRSLYPRPPAPTPTLGWCSPPATKQETRAGLWILYVNKYTEDVQEFEGSRGVCT